jgi:hypothetical protein
VASGVVGGVVFTSVFTPSQAIKFPLQWEALQIIKISDALLAQEQPEETSVLPLLFRVSRNFIDGLHSFNSMNRVTLLIDLSQWKE